MYPPELFDYLVLVAFQLCKSPDLPTYIDLWSFFVALEIFERFSVFFFFWNLWFSAGIIWSARWQTLIHPFGPKRNKRTMQNEFRSLCVEHVEVQSVVSYPKYFWLICIVRSKLMAWMNSECVSSPSRSKWKIVRISPWPTTQCMTFPSPTLWRQQIRSRSEFSRHLFLTCLPMTMQSQTGECLAHLCCNIALVVAAAKLLSYLAKVTESIPLALMHVTSWSESYPLRNSLMGVRCFRPVVSSFSFVLKRPALLALERQSQGMRSFSPPKTTSAGVSSRERLRCFMMKRSRSPVEEDIVDEERPTFKLSRGTSKFVLHRHRGFLALRQSKGSWQLDFWAKRCLKVWFESLYVDFGVYASSIQSDLAYGSNAFYSSLPQSAKEHLSRLSKRGVRAIFGAPPWTHTEPLLREMKLCSIDVRFKLKLLIHTYRCTHALASSLLCQQYKLRSHSNSTHSTTRSQLTLSLCIPSAARPWRPGTISPLFTSTLLWNSLPSPIRSASSLHTFRQELQKYLGIPVIRPR